MERSARFGGFAGVLVVLVLGYAGWRSFANSDGDQCYGCNRSIHAHARTVALVNGQSRRFFCSACALFPHRQARQAAHITQTTSFLTSAAPSPHRALLSEASGG